MSSRRPPEKKHQNVVRALEGGQDASAILGPLGSFSKTEHVMSAPDILRSLRADETSKSLQQSTSVKQFAGSTALGKQEGDVKAYVAPTDRIGCRYTPTARDLKLASRTRKSRYEDSPSDRAARVVKGLPRELHPRWATRALDLKARDDQLTRRARIAPVAYEAANAAHRPPQTAGTAVSSLSGGGDVNLKTTEDDDDDDRERRRIESHTVNRHVTVTEKRRHRRFFDPDAWNPLVGTTKKEEEAVVEETTTPTFESNRSLEAAKAHEAAVAAFWARVDEVLHRGAAHAAGAGKRRALASLPDAWLGGIAARVAPPVRLLEHRKKVVAARREVAKISGDEDSQSLIRATAQTEDWAFDAVRDAESAAEATLMEARDGFARGIARGAVLYELKDPSLAVGLGIDTKALDAAPKWWTNDVYQTYEWRVLRETGVPRRRVHVAFHVVARNLRTVEPVMRDLQALWLSPRPALPENQIVAKEDDDDPLDSGGTVATSSSSTKNDKKALRPPFAAVMLTDVHSASFRSRLPVTLDVFCAHVERNAAVVRDTLRDEWLGEAAVVLEDFLAPPLSLSGEDDEDEEQKKQDDVLPNLSNGSVSHGEDPLAVGDDFDTWFAEIYGAETAGKKQRSLEKKEKMPTMSGTIKATVRVSTRHRSILDCAACLMSRQLRGLCEMSLIKVVEYLERFDSDICDSTGEAAFELSLKLNDQLDQAVYKALNAANGGGGGDTLKNYGGPVVTVEPSLEQLQHHACACVDSIVAAVQRFPRADAVVAGAVAAAKPSKKKILDDTDDNKSDIDENKDEETAALSTTSGERKNRGLSQQQQQQQQQMEILGPCGIGIEDECVKEAKLRVKAALERRFAAPATLIEKFEQFAKLLTGELAEETNKVVAKCRRFFVLGKDLGEQSVREATDVALQMLKKECDGLKNLASEIRKATPDLCNFAMFQVVTSTVKEQLANRAENLRQSILDAVAQDNREHMHDVCRKYQEIADSLVDEPTTSAELRELKNYADVAVTLLEGLAKEYNDEILPRASFLLAQHHRGTKDDVAAVSTTYAWPTNILAYVQKSKELQDSRKKHLKMVVEGQREQLAREVTNLEKKIDKLAESSSLAPSEVQMVTRRVQAIREGLEAAQKEAEAVAAQEELLELPPTDHDARLTVIAKELAPLEKLWTIAREWVDRSHAWHELPLCEVDADDAAKRAAEYAGSLGKIAKILDKKGESRAPSRRACKLLLQEAAAFEQDEIPLLKFVCEPGMQARHWDEIKRITRLSFDVTPSTNLLNLMDIGMNHYVHLIEDTCVAAAKEASLDKALQTMHANWTDLTFATKQWRNGRILAGVDEIQQELDDQIVKTQGMRGSRYVKPYLSRVDEWERMLTTLQDVIDNWLEVQAAWLYLEPIFGSDDITRQLPAEAKLFSSVNAVWKESMDKTAQDPSVLAVAKREGLLESLKQANEKLETIQKGLNSYLEAKRLACPRFFFLSNDELLQILADTKDPLRVQPHLKKIFDGISSLEFTDDHDILACFDGPVGKSERLEFAYEKCQHKKINPKDFGGNVERWLVDVETIMKKSLAFAIDNALGDFHDKIHDRRLWLKSWQGQTILTVNQITWVSFIEKAIADGSLKKLVKTRIDDLLDVVKAVRGDIPKALRQTLGSLVVMDVHNRDVTKELAENPNLKSATDFDWQAHLRYYHCSDLKEKSSALTGNPGTLDCRMINASILYAYEYIGNCGRLVITPLTDRYVTIHSSRRLPR